MQPLDPWDDWSNEGETETSGLEVLCGCLLLALGVCAIALILALVALAA